MRSVLLLLLLLALPAAAADKPNVLFISIDDLNDWIGVLGGHAQAKTPNIDRLARSGVLFTHAYTAAPACNPSRAALMTGIAPHVSGVYLNSQAWRPTPVLRDADSIPQHFRKHGYWVAGAGKIYHGAFPDPPSWDVYFPDQQKNKPDDPMPDGRPLNGIPKTSHFDWGPVAARPEEMGDRQVADWVSQQLSKEHDKPFFLACGIFRPHLPWYVPPKYFEPFPLDKIELPAFNYNDLDDLPEFGVNRAISSGDHAKVIQHNQWRQAVQGYLASIYFADEQVGRVLDALENGPNADNTIVVLWTDHGWHLGEKEHWRKFALWEEATKTPLIWRVPKGVAPGMPEGTRAGVRVDAPVTLLELYPTLNELAGIAAKPGLSGVSVVPLLKNADAPWDRPALTTYGRRNHAVRTARWRYIRYRDGGEELYDHDVDGMEWKNLANDPDYRSVIEQLAKHLPENDAEDVPITR